MHLREINPDEYKFLYAHMKRDFPSNERPPFAVVKRNLERRVYSGYFLMCSGVEAGYALIIAQNGNSYAFIVFLAVFPEWRGKGYGGELLKLIE